MKKSYTTTTLKQKQLTFRMRGWKETIDLTLIAVLLCMLIDEQYWGISVTAVSVGDKFNSKLKLMTYVIY